MLLPWLLILPCCPVQGGEGEPEPAPEGTRSSNATQGQLTCSIRDQWRSFKSPVESLGSQGMTLPAPQL